MSRIIWGLGWIPIWIALAISDYSRGALSLWWTIGICIVCFGYAFQWLAARGMIRLAST